MTFRRFAPLILLLASAAQAQYTINDTALVSRLQVVVPEAMAGNVLDTTHTSVLNLSYLDLHATYVANLDGVRFFTGLDSLNVRSTDITQLTDLPAQLKGLNCAFTPLTTLPEDMPNSLEYLNCAYAELAQLPTNWPGSLRELNASYNNLTGITSLPPTVELLNLSGNGTTAISSLPGSLLDMSVQSNALSSLPDLPSGMVKLNAAANVLTTLPQLPPALEILVLSYNELTTLPALPDGLKELYVPVNNISDLPDLPPSLLKLSAGENGITSVPTLPANMEYLSLFNNQIEELPALPSTLTTLWVNINPIQCLPPLPPGLAELRCASTNITCLPNIPPGADYSAANLGFAPVVCGPEDNCFVTQSITGKLFHDLDGDGIFSAGEATIPYGQVEATPGPIMAGADWTGRFTLPVEAGTYTVQGAPRPYFTITTPPHEITINPGTSDTSAWIGYQPIPGIHDLVADLQAGAARPGFENVAFLSVLNNGTEVSGATLNLILDNVQSYVTSTIPPTTQTGNLITWHATIPPGGSWQTTVTLYTDVSTSLGTAFLHELHAEPLTIDTVPEDNVAQWADHVVGSFDPNDKRPSVEAIHVDDVADAWMDYTIRFQNTGTYLAENVVITDTLPAGLVWTSMKYISASHGGQWILRDGVLTVTFNDIQLPDSTSDLTGSQGYVHLRFKVQPDLLPGESIVNRANIFFDFNEPVITEDAVTLITTGVGIAEVATGQGSTRVVPNPVRDEAVIYLDVPMNGPGTLLVHSTTGQQVLRMAVDGGSSAIRFSTQQLRPGLYSYSILDGSGLYGSGKMGVVR